MPAAFATKYVVGGVLVTCKSKGVQLPSQLAWIILKHEKASLHTYVNVRSLYAVILTGMGTSSCARGTHRSIPEKK